MTQPATTGAATPQGVAGALARLAVAYFYLLSQGDWARASVVLSVFAETFNAHRDSLIAFIRASSADPDSAVRMVPQRSSTSFTSTGAGYDTHRALQVALLVGLSDPRLVPIVEAMPDVATPTVIRPWWEQVAAVIDAPSQQLGVDALQDPLSTLAANLRARVRAGIYGGTASTVTDTRVVPFDEPDPDAPPPGGTGPTTIIHAPSSGFRMPLWGWWALGVGVLTATGVVTYGVVEKGWFR